VQDEQEQVTEETVTAPAEPIAPEIPPEVPPETIAQPSPEDPAPAEQAEPPAPNVEQPA